MTTAALASSCPLGRPVGLCKWQILLPTTPVARIPTGCLSGWAAQRGFAGLGDSGFKGYEQEQEKGPDSLKAGHRAGQAGGGCEGQGCHVFRFSGFQV